jgi:hypothetical protein
MSYRIRLCEVDIMSIAEKSTNPQIDATDTTSSKQTDHEKMDQIADDMAGKAGRVQHKKESGINSGGGVSGGGGGVFSK